LKNVFLNKGQYEEAGRAYFKERQTRRRTHLPLKRARQCYLDELNDIAKSGLTRKYQLLNFSLRHIFAYLLDWAAEMTCGYGEKPLRTIWWAFVSIVIFSFLYSLSGGIVSINGATLNWLDYLNYSFGAFATVGFANFSTSTPLAQTLTSIEALVGISLLALLMFTLGNRISRS
jgi:hypothetical protein